MSVRLSFRSLALAAAVIGLAIGAAFGAGIAYGRSDPKQAPQGQTAQQVQAQLGLGGQSQTSGAGTQDQTSRQQTAGGAGQAAGRSTSGRITSVSDNSLTIETRQGSQKVNLAPSASVSRLVPASAADLREGMVVVASGTRKEDGSFDATALSEIAADLQSLIAGGGSVPAAGSPPSGTR